MKESKFVNEMREIENVKFTENGGRASKSVGSKLLDCFATIGALRTRSDNDIILKWRMASRENRELADNMILYARDIRNGGLGERKVARVLLKALAKVDPNKVKRNFDTIIGAGRWDDLFVFLGTPVEAEMLDFVKQQFLSDLSAINTERPISILAKWLPSVNTSSSETKRMAKYICSKWQLTEATYRKALAKLRRKLRVVEQAMSARKWEDIEFEKVPSLAMLKYNRAFDRNCGELFELYKEEVAEGKKKVNASTLYPYDIIRPYLNSSWHSNHSITEIEEQQWKSLPNYIKDEMEVLVVCDTSGSMFSCNATPISTAIGLGIYFAQRNKGAYHNMMMTFSQSPRVINLDDSYSLKKCIDVVKSSEWGWSTNLDATFEMIYNIAKKTHDVPKAVAIISDMEINMWDGSSAYKSITEKWATKFEHIGLACPKLIYWNVCARNDTFLANQNDNVAFVSGSGVGPFKNFIDLIENSAYDAMVKILTKRAFCWK